VATLNYHHLRLFRAIAKERSLTRAAAQLHLAPSALSTQLKDLEARLGHALFDRVGRGLDLNEAGRIALDYADTIFKAGDELVATLAGKRPAGAPALRVGSVATLSRNFQLGLVARHLKAGAGPLALHSGTLRELLAELSAHALDLVLSNVAPPVDARSAWRVHLLDRQPVSLVARPRRGARRFRFPADLDGASIVLPGPVSDIRTDFDLLVEREGVRPVVIAEVDDMAMLRLVAREAGALALVPPVVVRDELAARTLVERCKVPGIHERFYAIVPERRFPDPRVAALLRGAAANSPRDRLRA